MYYTLKRHSRMNLAKIEFKDLKKEITFNNKHPYEIASKFELLVSCHGEN